MNPPIAADAVADEQSFRSAAEMLPIVYDELRRLAAQKLSHESPGQTLQATALVHEVYLRLSGNQLFANSKHFFTAASEAMQRMLIDQARRKQAIKNGGNLERIDFPEFVIHNDLPPDELLALHDVIGELSETEPQKAQVVKMHYFLGMTFGEIAQILDLDPSTVIRYWTYSRTWIKTKLQ